MNSNSPQAILDRLGIGYKKHGRNIGRNFLGVVCPNESCKDARGHCGLHQIQGFYTCFVCGKSGSFEWFLKLNGVGYGLAKELASTLKLGASERASEEESLPIPTNGGLAKVMRDFKTPLSQVHRDYLESRNFDPDQLQRKYNLMGTDYIGRYKHRIVIPVIMNETVVGFTSRSISDKAQLKYLLSPEDINLVPRSQWLYNVDSVKKTNGVAVITEGPTDVFRVGEGAIALMTIAFSKQQVLSLIQLKLRKVFLLFDSEENATKKAYELANRLAPFVSTEVIESDEWSDPGSMSEIQVRDLRRSIF